MPQIFAHYTCTRVRWEQDEDGFTHPEPIEEHGWIDRRWSIFELYESRNDVSPIINLPIDSDELADEVKEALEWLEDGYEDNGDGTFYASQDYKPYDQEWSYSYALHFSIKLHGHNGWIEVPWHPVLDGGINL